MSAENKRVVFITDLQAQKEEERRQLHQRKLAAVAMEAIKVDESGNFVHTNRKTIFNSLRQKGITKIYPELISGAGLAILDGFRKDFQRQGDSQTAETYLEMPVSQFSTSETVTRVVPDYWMEVMKYATNKLPMDTTVRDVSYLLVLFQGIRRFKGVIERIAQVKPVSG